MTQRVHGHALVDVCLFCGGMDCAVQLPRAERVDGIEARNQRQQILLHGRQVETLERFSVVEVPVRPDGQGLQLR